MRAGIDDAKVAAIERRLRPWPPPAGSSVLLDLVRLLDPAPAPVDTEAAARIFTSDLVITFPALSAYGPFRQYFGLEGGVQAGRYWQRVGDDVTVVPERYAVAGDHALIVARIERASGPTPAAWLCSVRDERIRAVRGFRYVSEAVVRFAALAGADGAEG